MIINYYDTLGGKIKNYFEKRHPKLLEERLMPLGLHLYDKMSYAKIMKKVNTYDVNGVHPLFTSIEIETINRCNGSCSFCPINKYEDQRDFKKMTREMFLTIVEQLSEYNFEGNVGLYSNNEPLLDDRIIEFAQIARDKLPKAKLYMFTNGSLLTTDKFDSLIESLDRLIIDNYNDKLILNEPVDNIYKHIKSLDQDIQDKVTIFIRKENEVLLNRGGEAPNRSDNKLLVKSPCIYPFEQFVVRPDGKVSLCCNDALGKITMGDLTVNTIEEIWYGDLYCGLRYLMKMGRTYFPACTMCDAVTPDMFLDKLK